MLIDKLSDTPTCPAWEPGGLMVGPRSREDVVGELSDSIEWLASY